MQPITYRASTSNRILNVLSLGMFGLFLFVALIAAGVGLRWLEVPGTEWVESYGAADDIAYFWLYSAMAVFSGMAFAFILFARSPDRSYLTLDDAGLTYVFLNMRHEWPWRDLESASVLNRPFGIKAARLIVSGKFDWKARLRALQANGLASADRLAVMLPDFYGTPVEDIVAKLTEYRDQAVGAGRPGKAAARTARPTTATPGQPIVYAKSKRRYNQERAILYAALVVVGLVMVPMAVLVYLLMAEQTDFGPAYTALVLLLGLISVSWPAVFVVEFRRGQPRHNCLTLDSKGLTYTRRRRVYSWSWPDLSGFETKTAPTMVGRRFITFAAPGKDRNWWWLRLISRLPLQPPAVVVEDIYDTPLDEIAATLKAYRERAPGGGAA